MKPLLILKLFAPLIYYRIKYKKKYGAPLLQNEMHTMKETIYNCINILNERAKLELTDVQHLSEEVPFNGIQFLTVGNSEPCYYGDFYILQKYANVPLRMFPPKRLNIQHGILCELLDFELTKLNNVNWVWSDKIKNLFQEKTDNPHFYPIGSTFFYAKSILSEDEINKEKKRLGRNLLAFPSHSVYYADVQYDANNFISVLKEQKKNFDSVRVCIYWRDYQRGLAKVYEDEGFECVCCGHIYDPFFLERQRALLEIADATISNAVGSYVGHSVYLNKPHWMIRDRFEFKDLDARGAGKKESDLLYASPNYQRVRETFYDNSEYKITKAQRDIVAEYWGTSCIKSPVEIRALIEKAYELL